MNEAPLPELYHCPRCGDRRPHQVRHIPLFTSSFPICVQCSSEVTAVASTPTPAAIDDHPVAARALRSPLTPTGEARLQEQLRRAQERCDLAEARPPTDQHAPLRQVGDRRTIAALLTITHDNGSESEVPIEVEEMLTEDRRNLSVPAKRQITHTYRIATAVHIRRSCPDGQPGQERQVIVTEINELVAERILAERAARTQQGEVRAVYNRTAQRGNELFSLESVPGTDPNPWWTNRYEYRGGRVRAHPCTPVLTQEELDEAMQEIKAAIRGRDSY